MLRARISEIARPSLAAGFTRAHPNQGYALLGGSHALVMALRPDIEPQAALAEIVQQGYDTDTVAAICGSILGARFGCGWIPVDRLVDHDRLTAYADALVQAMACRRTWRVSCSARQRSPKLAGSDAGSDAF